MLQLNAEEWNQVDSLLHILVTKPRNPTRLGSHDSVRLSLPSFDPNQRPPY